MHQALVELARSQERGARDLAVAVAVGRDHAVREPAGGRRRARLGALENEWPDVGGRRVLARRGIRVGHARDVRGLLAEKMAHAVVAEGDDAAGIGDVAHLVRVHDDGFGARKGQEGAADFLAAPPGLHGALVAAGLDLEPARGKTIDGGNPLGLLRLPAARTYEQGAEVARPGRVHMEPEAGVLVLLETAAEIVDAMHRIDGALLGGPRDGHHGQRNLPLPQRGFELVFEVADLQPEGRDRHRRTRDGRGRCRADPRPC